MTNITPLFDYKTIENFEMTNVKFEIHQAVRGEITAQIIKFSYTMLEVETVQFVSTSTDFFKDDRKVKFMKTNEMIFNKQVKMFSGMDSYLHN